MCDVFMLVINSLKSKFSSDYVEHYFQLQISDHTQEKRMAEETLNKEPSLRPVWEKGVIIDTVILDYIERCFLPVFKASWLPEEVRRLLIFFFRACSQPS